MGQGAARIEVAETYHLLYRGTPPDEISTMKVEPAEVMSFPYLSYAIVTLKTPLVPSEKCPMVLSGIHTHDPHVFTIVLEYSQYDAECLTRFWPPGAYAKPLAGVISAEFYDRWGAYSIHHTCGKKQLAKFMENLVAHPPRLRHFFVFHATFWISIEQSITH